MFWSPGNRFNGVQPGIDIFKHENIGTEKPLPLHPCAKPLCDFHVQRLLNIGRLRAPDRALWNLELNENILFLVFRIFRPDEFDGTDFTNGHSAKFDQGTDGEIFDFARDTGFKYFVLAKIGLQAHRKERSDKQQGSRQHKKPNSKMMGLDAHAASRFRNCRTHGWLAFSRNHDGAPSAAIPRVFGSSTTTRSATE